MILIVCVYVCVCVFFTLSDPALTIPSNVRGCQSGTWSAGQEKNRRTPTTKLQREHKNKNETKTAKILGLKNLARVIL